MTDIFEKSLSEIKIPDYAKELNLIYGKLPSAPTNVPAVPAARRGSALFDAIDIINANKRQDTAETALQRQLKKAGLVDGALGKQVDLLPTWDTAKAALGGFDNLPYSEQNRLYGEFVSANVTKLKEANPKADEFEIENLIRTKNVAPVKPERGIVNAVTDIGRGISKGALGLIGSGADFIDPASNVASRLRKTTSDLGANMSDVERDVQKQTAFDNSQIAPDASTFERVTSEAGNTLGNLSLGNVSELVGNLIPSLALSGGVGLTARGAAAAAGITDAVAAARIAQGATVASGVLLSAVTTGGEAAGSAYTQIKNLPIETLRRDPEWPDVLAAAGGDEDAAREALAKDAAATARAVGTSIGAATSIIPGSLENVVGRAVARQAGLRAAQEAPGLLAKAGRFAGTSAVEGLEEVGSSFGANVGVRGVDPTQRLDEGTGSDFALGALGGGGGHVVTHLAESLAGTPTAPAPSGAQGPSPTDVLQPEGDQADAPAEPEVGVPFDVDGNGTMMIRAADGTLSYAPGQEPNAIGDVLIASRTTAAAAPAAPGPIPGTTTLVGGATLVVGPDGTWGYGEGAEPNAAADAALAVRNGPALGTTEFVPAPAEAGEQAPVETAPGEFDVPDPPELTDEQLAERAANPPPVRIDPPPEAGGNAVEQAPLPEEPAVPPEGWDTVDAGVQNAGLEAAVQIADTTPAVTQALAALPPRVQEVDAGLRSSAVTDLSNAATTFPALQELNRQVASLTPEEFTAATAAVNTLGASAFPPSVSPLLYAIGQLGLQRSIAREPVGSAPWADNVRRADPLAVVLTSLATSPDQVGLANSSVARNIANLFRVSGIPMPSMRFQQAQQGQGILGSYSPAEHRLTFSPASTANTVLHEAIHALTSRGLNRIQISARTSVSSRNFIKLLDELNAILTTAAGDRTTRGNADIHEMFAELVRPEFLALAAATPLDRSALSEEAQTALANVERLTGEGRPRTFLDVIARMVKYVLRLVNPRADIPLDSVLQVLTQAAATVTNLNAGTFEPSQMEREGIAPAAPAAPAAAPSVPSRVTQVLRDRFEQLQAAIRSPQGVNRSDVGDLMRQVAALPGTTETVQLGLTAARGRGDSITNPRVVQLLEAGLQSNGSLQGQPVRAPAVPSTPAAPQVDTDRQLPRILRRTGSNPLRYQTRALTFNNDTDLALYIVSNRSRPSPRDGKYRAWLYAQGFTPALVDQYASALRQAVTQQARTTTGPLRIEPFAPGFNPETRLPQAVRTTAPTSPGVSRLRAMSGALSDRVAEGFQQLASSRIASGLMRQLQPTGALGSLIPATATTTQRIEHFQDALRAGIEALNARPGWANRFHLLQSGDVRIDGNVAEVYLNRNGTDPYVSLGTTSLGGVRDSGQTEAAGAAFYDLINGAAASSRLRVTNNGLTTRNSYRLPINRLRAILKWGAITGDFANALRSLSTDASRSALQAGSITPMQALARQISLVANNASENRSATLGDGRIVFDPETNTVKVGDRSYTLPQLRAAAYASSSSPDTRARSASSTPDTIALAGLANALQDAPTDEARQQVLDAAVGNGLFQTIFSAEDGIDTTEGSLADEIFALDDTTVMQADTEQGANSISPDVLPQRRETFTELQTDIANGTPAEPTTPTREFGQALRRGDRQGAMHAVTNVGAWLNQKLHDHLVPMKRWIENLPGITDALRESLIGSMYRAPGTRDALLATAMTENGGNRLNQLIAAFATKYNVTVETAIRDAGYWITAKRVPSGNAMLLQRDTDAVRAAQEALANGTGTQAAVNAAVAQLIARTEAVNNRATRVKTHTGKGVAGMNNAQAQLLVNNIEARYSEADLQAMAEQVYNLNAWRLATDVENGKASPHTVATFLRQPQLEPLLKDLRDLGARVTAEDQSGLAQLEALREEVISAVRSNYVPLTGDPTTALTEDLFYHGSRQPNAAPDYRMEGRTTSVPDDGISTTFAAVLKSASYAGWRDFQDNIARAYHSMSAEQREQAGIYRQVMGDRTALPQGAIVRRRNGRSVAYFLRDPKLLEAVRGSNFEDNSNLMLFGLGKFTKLYSYAATQLAPWFAPKNFLRDFWDRSELIRTRTYTDANGAPVNSTAVARQMLSYLLAPNRLKDLLNATGRNAYAIPSTTRESKYLTELMNAGGASIFGDRFASNRTDMVRAIEQEKNGFKQLKLLKDYIGKYNRTFDLGPSLAAYMALRDAGVPVDRAAAGVLDLMNFRKRGENSALISAVYAFAQPSITSGVNTFASLKTKRGQARLIGYSVGLMAIQAFFRSLADDDEGGNRLDQQSDFLKNTHLLIPFGNGIIKFPLAFGSVRIANGLARAAIGVTNGNLTVSEALGDTVSGSIVPVISPIEDTNISWRDRPVQAFVTTFAPTWLKPVFSVGFNLTPWGTPIVYDSYEKTTQFRSEQFGKSVAPTYKEIAIELRQMFGLDLAPEEVKTLINGYPLGPGTIAINQWIDNPYAETKGRKTDNPLTQQVYANYSESAIYFQFREAVDDTNQLLKRYNAGEKEFSQRETDMLAWRRQWDHVDAAFRKKKAAITRDKTLTEAGKDTRKALLDREREQATTLSVYQYRVATGQPAKRVEAFKPNP